MLMNFNYADPSEIHIRAYPPRLPAPKLQLPRPLGHLARLHLQHYYYCLDHRQYNSRLRLARLANRRASRTCYVSAAIRVHVAIRQLEQRRREEDEALGVYGGLECDGGCRGDVLDGCGHVWLCEGDYGCL